MTRARECSLLYDFRWASRIIRYSWMRLQEIQGFFSLTASLWQIIFPRPAKSNLDVATSSSDCWAPKVGLGTRAGKLNSRVSPLSHAQKKVSDPFSFFIGRKKEVGEDGVEGPMQNPLPNRFSSFAHRLKILFSYTLAFAWAWK